MPVMQNQDDPKFSDLALLLSGFDPRAAQPAQPVARAIPPMAPPADGQGYPNVRPAAAPTALDAAAPPTPPAQPSNPNVLPPTTVDQARTPAVQARHAGLEAEVGQYAKATDPNQYKPSILERIFSGMTTFGAAMNHNPNAVELGQNQLHQRYNRAEYTRKENLKGAQEQLGDFEKGEKVYDDQWHREMERSQAERQGRVADAQINEYNSRAEKNKADAKRKDYQGMDYTERAAEIPNVEKALGKPMDDEEKKYFIINGKLPNPEKQQKTGVKTVQEGLFSDDPAVQKKAERYFNEEHRDKSGDSKGGAKPATAAQKRVLEDDINTKFEQHKTKLQNQIADLNKKRSMGVLDDGTYKSKMAELERGDYDTMRMIADDKRKQYAALGVEIPKEEPTPWQQSFLPENERPRPSQQGAQPQQSTQQSTPQGGGKTASKDDVQAYATKKKIPYATAEAAFKKGGYTIK